MYSCVYTTQKLISFSSVVFNFAFIDFEGKRIRIVFVSPWVFKRRKN